SGVTSRGQTMTPEEPKPSKCPCLTKLPRERCPQLIASKALSWGIIRKPACILADITLRKSQERALVCTESALTGGAAEASFSVAVHLDVVRTDLVAVGARGVVTPLTCSFHGASFLPG